MMNIKKPKKPVKNDLREIDSDLLQILEIENILQRGEK